MVRTLIVPFVIIESCWLILAVNSRKAFWPCGMIKVSHSRERVPHFGAREATIFSKGGYPRNGSQYGSSFKCP